MEFCQTWMAGYTGNKLIAGHCKQSYTHIHMAHWKTRYFIRMQPWTVESSHNSRYNDQSPTVRPIAVETQGPLNESARDLLSDVGRKIFERSGDKREIQFLFQRISVVVQRFNCVLLYDSFCNEDQSDW